MENLIVENPDAREVPAPSTLTEISPNSVAEDLEYYIHRNGNENAVEFRAVATRDQLVQEIANVQPEIAASNTVVLDVARDPGDCSFGTLTIGSTKGTVIVVALHSLMINSRMSLAQLVRGPLKDVCGWISCSNIATFFPCRARWAEFERIAMFEDTPHRGCYDGLKVIEKAISSGRIKAPWGELQNSEHFQALLSWAYAGKSLDAVSEEEYSKAFQGLRRPQHRDPQHLYDWPQRTASSPLFFSLHHVRLYLTRHRSFILALMDAVMDGVVVRELRRSSRGTPLVLKSNYVRQFGRGGVGRMALTVDVSFDENSIGPNCDGHLDEVLALKRLVLARFGELCHDQPLPGNAPPGAQIRKTMMGNACVHCAIIHGPNRPLCDLGRRMLRGEVNFGEINCTTCYAHDHFEAACPVSCNRCSTCDRTGHLPELCAKYTEQEHFERFLETAPRGIFTSIEPHGPCYGPFGFGTACGLIVNQSLQLKVREVGITMFVRFKFASPEILEIRQTAVRCVIGRLRHQSLVYPNEKTPDQSWVEYQRANERRTRPRKSIGPYRGTSATVLDTFDREEGAPLRESTPVIVVTNSMVHEDDAKRRVEIVEATQREESPEINLVPSPQTPDDPERLQSLLEAARRGEKRCTPGEALRLAEESLVEEPEPTIEDAGAAESHPDPSGTMEDPRPGPSWSTDDPCPGPSRATDKTQPGLYETQDEPPLELTLQEAATIEFQQAEALEMDTVEHLRNTNPDLTVTEIAARLREIYGPSSVLAPQMEEVARSVSQSGSKSKKKRRKRSSLRKIQYGLLSERKQELDRQQAPEQPASEPRPGTEAESPPLVLEEDSDDGPSDPTPAASDPNEPSAAAPTTVQPEDLRTPTGGARDPKQATRVTRSQTGKTKAKRPYTPTSSGTSEEDKPLQRSGKKKTKKK